MVPTIQYLTIHSRTAEIAADERAARLKSEQIQAALNDSANEAETSSVGTSSDGRDSRAGDDIKTSKRLVTCSVYGLVFIRFLIFCGRSKTKQEILMLVVSREQLVHSMMKEGIEFSAVQVCLVFIVELYIFNDLY